MSASALPDGVSTAGAPHEAGRVCVRSEGLGLLRRSHPEHLPDAVRVGQTVEAGQVLALLELDGVYTPVRAPRAGTVVVVHGEEHEIADYGMPLFVLTSALAATAPADNCEDQAASAARLAELPVPETRSAGEHPITAPMTGTLHRAARPGAAPLVEVGSRVAPGTPLCVIEAMKMFSTLYAEHAGTIVRVLVDDGQPVETGQTLFVLAIEEAPHVS